MQGEIGDPPRAQRRSYWSAISRSSIHYGKRLCYRMSQPVDNTVTEDTTEMKDADTATREGGFWMRATMGGDVRIDVLDEHEQPIVFFIIPKERAHTIAMQLVSLAGTAN
jgi:hypothetical protein